MIPEAQKGRKLDAASTLRRCEQRSGREVRDKASAAAGRAIGQNNLPGYGSYVRASVSVRR